MTVSRAGELRTIYREPNARAALKVLDHLDAHCRNFIAPSPFLVLSTASALCTVISEFTSAER